MRSPFSAARIRCDPVPIGAVGVGTAREQQTNQLVVTPCRGKAQGGGATPGFDIHFRARFDEKRSGFDTPRFDRIKKWRPPNRAAGVKVGTRVEKDFDGFQITAFCRIHQRGHPERALGFCRNPRSQ